MTYRNKTVLLVEDEDEVREVTRLSIELSLSCKVLEANSVESAIGFLKNEGSKVDLIVCDHNLHKNKGISVLKFVRENDLSIPFILMSAMQAAPEYAGNHFLGFVEKPNIIDPLEEMITKEFVSQIEEKAELAEESAMDGKRITAESEFDFIPVRISMIIKMERVDFDYYIKLSDQKFVKIANADDKFEVLDAKSYLSRNITSLYIKNEDSKNLLNELQTMLNFICENENLETGPAEQVKLSVDAHVLMCDMSEAFGWNEEIEELTQKNVNLAIRAAKNTPELKSLIDKHLVDPNSYISSHSMLLAYVAVGLAMQLEWSSKYTYIKLSLAAVVHDLALSETELDSITKLRNQALDPDFDDDKITIQFKRHPTTAAALLAKMKQVPPDVESIILQHEERPDGSGFPHKLGHQRMSPLSSLFIITENLVDTLFRTDNTKEAIDRFLSENEKLYSCGHFKEIYELIDTLSDGTYKEQKIIG